MSVLMCIEMPGATVEQYDRLNQELDARPGHEPDGLISHTCAVVEGGLLISDVWRSQEQLDAFVKNRVMPAAEKLGMRASEPKIGRVHNQLGAHLTSA
jgi:hypothetical protein